MAKRVLITLLGIALIIYGLGMAMLGIVGERATAIITSVRRQGGERDEAVPGRYTYSIGYRFPLPDGRTIDGSTTRIGSSVYIKTTGTSTAPVRYFKSLPYFNALESHTTPAIGQLIVAIAGGFIVLAENRRR
ncbi:MAG TPA: hypothetical protein DCL63_09600 [Firmicutes bacterium]|nr:hypothetical protein [Bacillota bacterium]HBK60828.1 hypothetical protein [Bacillota bacterium]